MTARRVAFALVVMLVANVVGLVLLVRVHRRGADARAHAATELRTVSMRVATPEPPQVEPEPLPVPRNLAREARALLPVPDLPSALRAPRLERPDIDLTRQLTPSLEKGADTSDLTNRLLILDTVDEPPRVARRVLPEYPRRAEFVGVTEGRVLVEIRVDAEGGVEDLEVVEAEPRGYFEEVTLEAVQKWRFTPAIFQGRAVAVRVRTEVRFTLEDW